MEDEINLWVIFYLDRKWLIFVCGIVGIFMEEVGNYCIEFSFCNFVSKFFNKVSYNSE